MEFFSDKELGKKDLISENIPLNVYNAIIGIFNKYEISFCKEYPRYNRDNKVIGTDRKALVSSIMGYIPAMEHMSTVDDESEMPDKYAILDFIQFCYYKIHDVVVYDSDFFGNDIYAFPDSQDIRKLFREEINQLFERNQIVFYLDIDGMLKRHLPLGMENIIKNLPVNTNDDRLNELIKQSIENIHKPREKERMLAVEKIWDAFERMKTYYEELNKKQSADLLVKNVSSGTEGFYEILNSEFTLLKNIGNNYQIRHFEKGKIQITKIEHIDYLFHRMISIIALCLNELNN